MRRVVTRQLDEVEIAVTVEVAQQDDDGILPLGGQTAGGSIGEVGGAVVEEELVARGDGRAPHAAHHQVDVAVAVDVPGREGDPGFGERGKRSVDPAIVLAQQQ